MECIIESSTLGKGNNKVASNEQVQTSVVGGGVQMVMGMDMVCERERLEECTCSEERDICVK